MAWRRPKGSAGEAGRGHRHSEVEIAGALLCVGAIHRPAPALSSALRRRSPPTSASALPALRLRSPLRCTGALARAVLALCAAIHLRSTLHCDGALFCGAPELYIGLRGRSMPAPALFPLLRSSPPSFAGGLPYTMPTLGHAKAA